MLKKSWPSFQYYVKKIEAKTKNGFLLLKKCGGRVTHWEKKMQSYMYKKS